MNDLDERMHAWAIAELVSWGEDPTPENVEHLLGTVMAARQRAHFATRNLGWLASALIRRRLRRLEERMARRRDKALRQEGWIR